MERAVVFLWVWGCYRLQAISLSRASEVVDVSAATISRSVLDQRNCIHNSFDPFQQYRNFGGLLLCEGELAAVYPGYE